MPKLPQEFQVSIHLIIALIAFSVAIYGGGLIMLLLAPYVLYMLWSRNPIYLPALFIYFSAGNIISLLILITTLIMAVRYFNIIKYKKAAWIFRSLIVLLPVFIYFYYKLFFLQNKSLGLTLEYSGFYLGFFSFLYGVIISDRVNATVWKYIVLSLFIFPLLMLLPSFQFTIRLYWLSFPLFTTLFLLYGLKLWKYFKYFKYKHLSFFFVCIAFLIIGFRFTLFFSALISTIIVYLSAKKNYRGLNLLSAKHISVLSVIIVIMIISFGNNYVVNSTSIDLGANVFGSVDNFLNYLSYKAFNDRSVLWIGGWNFLVEEHHIWPTGEAPTYSYRTTTGSTIDDVSYGIHNIGLELMRYYGIVIGGYLVVIYLILISLLSKTIRKSNNVYVVIFSSVIIGTGIVGGMVGQFVLQITFSFIMFSIAGICYGYRSNINKTITNE